MKKINFKNGTLVSKAKVTINSTIYEVEPEEYEGETPLSAEVLNEMQNNIEEAINAGDAKTAHKVLWKNTNPTANFETQTIDVVEEFDVYKVYYKRSTSSSDVDNKELIDEFSVRLDFTSPYMPAGKYYTAFYRRSASRAGTKITFGNASIYTSQSTDAETTGNNYCIPVMIVGYNLANNA